MTVAYTYAQLKAPRSEDSIVASQLATLQSYGFPVTAWESGSLARSLVQADSKVLAELYALVASVAMSGILDDASDDWLDAIAAGFFDELRLPGDILQGYVTLTDTGGNGPFTINANDLWVSVGNGGQRYNNLLPVVVPLNGSAQVLVQAEAIGAGYNVANFQISEVGSGFPGLTVHNPPIVLNGSVTTTGAASYAAGVIIQILAPGDAAAGTPRYRVSQDSGFTFGPPTAMPVGGIVTLLGVAFQFSGTLLPGDTVTATLSTALPASGVTYSSTSSLTAIWITQAGADAETDVQLKLRCKRKWGSISTGATADAYSYWATSISSQITKVTSRADPNGYGIVLVTCAGPAGAVPYPVVTALSALLQIKRPLCTTVVVQSATTMTIPIAGSVYVESNRLADAQNDVAIAIAELVAELPIGGVVYRSELIQRIMDVTGVINLELASPTSNVFLGIDQVATFTLSGLTWVTV